MKTIGKIISESKAAIHGSPTRPATVLSDKEITDLKVLFVGVAGRVCPGFVWRVTLRETYNKIFRWCLMLRDSDQDLDPDKGLWLYGNVGTGKSTMLKIIKEFCKIVRPLKADGFPYSFRITNAVDVCSQFKENAYIGIGSYVRQPYQAFDELGSESKYTANYRDVLNIFEFILQRRYDNPDTKFTTHVTTNLSLEQIAERYTERIWDRCIEMFNFVEFKGTSFRK